MEAGLLMRYGKLVPGREQAAFDLFNEAVTYFGEKIKKGVVTFFEPFFFKTGDLETETGFMVIKGPAPEIFKLIEEDKFRLLVQKAYYLVEHFRYDILTVGEGVALQLESSQKVRAELGLH